MEGGGERELPYVRLQQQKGDEKRATGRGGWKKIGNCEVSQWLLLG